MPPATARWDDLFSPAETAQIAADMDRGAALLSQRVWNSAARKWVPRATAAPAAEAA